jgi:hypothetical protein
MNKIVLFFIAAVVGFSSCKNESNEIPTKTLEMSKSSKIKIGEPVTVNTTTVGSTTADAWSVTPSGFSKVVTSGTSAAISFTKSGNYVVSVKSASGVYSSSVNVQDSIYNPGVSRSSVISPTTNDQLTIKPILLPADSITGVMLEAKTTNQYDCLNNVLLYKSEHVGADFNITFNGVQTPENGIVGKSQSVAYLYLAPLKEGSQNFHITFNQVVYSGSVLKAGNSYTFTWPYTSGVTISPLSVSK